MISMSSYVDLSFLVILDKTVEIHKLAAFLPAKSSLFTIKIHCSKLPNRSYRLFALICPSIQMFIPPLPTLARNISWCVRSTLMNSYTMFVHLYVR